MEVVNFKEAKPKTRQDMIDTLRYLLERAHNERLDYLEVHYRVGGIEESKHHIDGVYSA